MMRVILETPYAADTAEGILANLEYLRDCARECLERKEAPFASHALYTQWLDDKNPAERRLGIDAGFAWGADAEKVCVYIDHGFSPGMVKGIQRALRLHMPIEFRRLVIGVVQVEIGLTFSEKQGR